EEQAAGFSEAGEDGHHRSRGEAQAAKHPRRALGAGAAEPTEELLKAVPCHRQPDDRAKQKNPIRHVTHLLRLWDQLFPVRLALNHQSTARSHGLVRATAISPTLISAPVAMIVPGAARAAIDAANARPIGISPNEPKKSRLTTRESRWFGTSSCSIVSQIATPKPRQKPRT